MPAHAAASIGIFLHLRAYSIHRKYPRAYLIYRMIHTHLSVPICVNNRRFQNAGGTHPARFTGLDLSYDRCFKLVFEDRELMAATMQEASTALQSIGYDKTQEIYKNDVVFRSYGDVVHGTKQIMLVLAALVQIHASLTGAVKRSRALRFNNWAITAPNADAVPPLLRHIPDRLRVIFDLDKADEESEEEEEGGEEEEVGEEEEESEEEEEPEEEEESEEEEEEVCIL